MQRHADWFLAQRILEKKVFPPVREKLISILGDLEIDELFNFVVEHVQQHASPQTIVEGLEPVSEVTRTDDPRVLNGALPSLTFRFSTKKPSHSLYAYGAHWPSNRPHSRPD